MFLGTLAWSESEITCTASSTLQVNPPHHPLSSTCLPIVLLQGTTQRYKPARGKGTNAGLIYPSFRISRIVLSSSRRPIQLAIQPIHPNPNSLAPFSTSTPTYTPSKPRTTTTTTPNPLPSSNAAPTPRQPTDTYTQGTVPPGAPNLIAPFPSESVHSLYAKREPSPEGVIPATHSASTSVDPPHPTTTSKAPHTGEEAVGSSAEVRFREPSWEDKKGGKYGTGLMDEGAVVRNRESGLGERNRWPDEEQGRLGNAEAWKTRK